MNTEHVIEPPDENGCICPQDFTRPDCPSCAQVGDVSDFAGLPYEQQNVTPGLPSYRIVAVSADTIQEAARHYLTDPILRRRVDTAVTTMEREHGIRFDDHDRSLATEAASVALLIAERDGRRQ